MEYGDFECPSCGQAEPVLREVLAGHGDVRYVWRHLPLNDVHPHAQLAAEDTDTGELSGVTGTPTFFINGRRHYGSYDITALTSAVLAAKAAAAASP